MNDHRAVLAILKSTFDRITDTRELRLFQQEINDLYSSRKSALCKTFAIGDRVSFKSKRGVIEGVIARHNRKSVSVDTPGGRWRVSPILLRKVD